MYSYFVTSSLKLFLFIIKRATTMCVVSAGFSSFFNGLVVFTILGYMAKESGMDVHEVASASG